MKLRVLVDNNTTVDNYFCGESGACYYIEDNDKSLIFDMGYSDIFLKNAQAMNINLENVDIFAFSHGHDDHTGGIRYMLDSYDMSKKKVVAHPTAFVPKKSLSGLNIGAPIYNSELALKCQLVLTKEPLKLTDHITFLGQIPRVYDFEKKKVCGTYYDGNRWTEDYLEDDTALVYHCSEGIFIITGCSHSGICSITEYAKRVCNDDRVIGIIGGFHLLTQSEKSDETIKYLKNSHIKQLYPCHCVSLHVKGQMMNEMDINEVGVGKELNI